MIRTRWATAADIPDLAGRHTIRARVAEQDGRIVAVLGYYVQDGIARVFSEVREPLPKMTIWREAAAMMARIKVPAVCLADRDHPGSCRLLERLGWQHAGTTPEGEVYAWRS